MSGPFITFIKWCNLLIFSGLSYLFLIVSVYAINWERKDNQIIITIAWWIKKSLDLGSSSPSHAKYFLKTMPMEISINWQGFMSKSFTIQNIHSKMYFTSCANTRLWRYNFGIWWSGLKCKSNISWIQHDFSMKEKNPKIQRFSSFSGGSL